MNAYTLFAVLILIVSLLLILVILVQNPKGGGLNASLGGGGGQMLGGVKQTNDFLEKSTWTLIAALVGFILLSNFVIPRNNNLNNQEQTELNNILDNDLQLNTPAAEPAKQEENTPVAE